MRVETKENLVSVGIGDPCRSSLAACQKRAARLERWRHPDVAFAGAQAEEDYRSRVDRLVAAIQLHKPDQVPIRLNTGLWPARAAGMSARDAMTDPEGSRRAWVDFNRTYQPDAICTPTNYAIPAEVFEALDYRLYSWPGHGVSDEAGYQYLEREWMLADEYDRLIADPTDFLVRVYLPRTVGAFVGFGGLPSFFDFCELPFVSAHIGSWGAPDMVAGLERIARAARTMADWGKAVFSLTQELMELGFPPYSATITKAPFDILGDTLRGTKGIMTDMFRCPDRVLAACDRLVPVAIDWAMRQSETPLSPLVAIPLHKGADNFMSLEQFRIFYWPTLRSLLLGLIEEGMIPFLFAEGRYNTRLETITDLPEGSTVWLFDQTDMQAAKATIGQVACIQGNVPLSLLHAGTPAQVARYTRELITRAGEGGGFILDFGAVANDGRLENLEAMIDTARRYGTY